MASLALKTTGRFLCEVCGAERSIRCFSKDGYVFHRCLGCRHVAILLTLSDEELVRLYDTEFFKSGSYADYQVDKTVIQENFARFLGYLKPLHPGGRLLDIGCAYGFFLELARQCWDVEGIDVVHEPTALARGQLHLKVITGDFLEVPFSEPSYDVVTMWDTIEHLRHPSAYVAKIARILKPGGVLALTTGDVDSLLATLQGTHWRLYDPPFHIHYFSRHTIRQLLVQYGFEIVSLRSAGYSRTLNLVLHRLFVYRKPAWMHGVYHLAKRLGLTQHEMYINLGDIMFVIAKKRDQPLKMDA